MRRIAGSLRMTVAPHQPLALGARLDRSRRALGIWALPDSFQAIWRGTPIFIPLRRCATRRELQLAPDCSIGVLPREADSPNCASWSDLFLGPVRHRLASRERGYNPSRRLLALSGEPHDLRSLASLADRFRGCSPRGLRALGCCPVSRHYGERRG